ncbi:hypothetical protein FRC07_012239, partial [Ceratobasidium sp. 392]
MHHVLSRGLALLAVAIPAVFALDAADDFFHGTPGQARHRHRTLPIFNNFWHQTDSYQGEDFLKDFTFEAIPDPTHGRVNYVDMQTAIAHNLTQCTPRGNFIMRADSTSVLDPSGPGRESIRLQSKKQWTNGVFVLNLNHMPVGCGTWPAYWMTQHVGWPKNGEIDVLEGVNDQIPNRSALHTINNCTITPSRP